MSKEITCYKCDVCKEIYIEKNLAETCEKAHRTDDKLKIIDSKHLPNDSEHGFPEQILVEIIDHSGVLAVYSRSDEGSMEIICEDWYPEDE